MIVTRALKSLVAAVRMAERVATKDLAAELIQTEPSLTDRLMGGMRVAVEQAKVRGYRVSIRTLRDRGDHAPETEFGADLVVVFEVDTPEFKVQKGFLAQAKMAGKAEVSLGPGAKRPFVLARRPARKVDRKSDLAPQCANMLKVSSSSYVFVYSERGVSVVPANAITHLKPGLPAVRVHADPLPVFFNQFFRCFVGDEGLDASDDVSLRRLRERAQAREAMILTLQSNA